MTGTVGSGEGARRCAGDTLILVLLWIGLLAPGSLGASPQEPVTPQPPSDRRTPRTASVTSISDPITIDGVLDEPVWGTTPTIGALVQRQPNPGTEPSERTDVRLLYDDGHLYIGVMAYDSEPPTSPRTPPVPWWMA
jgi:hypothetical protein